MFEIEIFEVRKNEEVNVNTISNKETNVKEEEEHPGILTLNTTNKILLTW